jgi:DNA-binding response OmpR family regulator
MADSGRILFADDEMVFLSAMGESLRRAGYDCDGVSDAPAALELLRQAKAPGGRQYDLVISDIKMPGNSELRLVRELAEIAPGIPVILVTGYPSFDSAVQSIELPVVAYLTKPLRFEELLKYVRLAIGRSQNVRLVRNTRQRLQDWRLELDRIEQVMTGKTENNASASVDAFMALTMRNLAGCLADLQRITEAMNMSAAGQSACQLLNCPRPAKLTEAVRKTIRVLEETKRSFKSKELAELRLELQELLGQG